MLSQLGLALDASGDCGQQKRVDSTSAQHQMMEPGNLMEEIRRQLNEGVQPTA